MRFAIEYGTFYPKLGGLAPWTDISDDHDVLWTSTGWGQRFRQREHSIATPA